MFNAAELIEELAVKEVISWLSLESSVFEDEEANSKSDYDYSKTGKEHSDMSFVVELRNYRNIKNKNLLFNCIFRYHKITKDGKFEKIELIANIINTPVSLTKEFKDSVSESDFINFLKELVKLYDEK